MADATPKPSVSPARHNSRWAGYWHLLLVRILELKREPEVVFWVFVFPLLLAAGLGIAFRNKPAERSAVAVVAGPNAEKVFAMLGGSDKRSALDPVILEKEAALRGLHVGKFDVVVESDSEGSFDYYYDPARPESASARVTVDDTLEASAGRADKLTVVNHGSSEPGSRYIDFLIPGLLGMNLMNSGMWGIGFAIVEMRQRKLLKRFVATPMRRSDFLLALISSRLVLMVIEVGLLLGFGVLVFHMRVQGSVWRSSHSDRLGPSPSAASDCRLLVARRRSKAFPA